MLYVNPISGNDAAAGNQAAPLKSLTRALRGVSPGTVIRLAAGTYDGANGEAFPLIVPPGVTVSGDETSQGRSIAIAGSGRYNSPTFGGQSVAVLLQGDAQLRGVTVTNRASGGTVSNNRGGWSNETAMDCWGVLVEVSGVATPASRQTLRVSWRAVTPSFHGAMTRATMRGSNISGRREVKSPPRRPMEVAKKMEASSASFSPEASSIRCTATVSMARKDWTRRVVHMDKSDAEELEVLRPGVARKMALNWVAISKTLCMCVYLYMCVCCEVMNTLVRYQ